MSAIGRTLSCALLVAFAIYAALFRVTAENERLAEPVSAMQIASAVPDGRVLRFASLGHNEAMADLVWLNALSFYGRYFYLDTNVTWLDPHVEAIVELDPKFRLVFEWAGSVIMYSGRIDNESIMAANRFLEIGAERFPLDWNIRFMLGVNYYYELLPTTEEELELVEGWRAYGAEQISVAAGLPNAPDNLRLTAASLLRRRAGWERQIFHYRSNYLPARSSEARTLRRHLTLGMPPDEGEMWNRRRVLLTAMTQQPQWGYPPYDLGLMLHLDPIRLFPSETLEPPPFELTR